MRTSGRTTIGLVIILSLFSIGNATNCYGDNPKCCSILGNDPDIDEMEDAQMVNEYYEKYCEFVSECGSTRPIIDVECCESGGEYECKLYDCLFRNAFYNDLWM